MKRLAQWKWGIGLFAAAVLAAPASEANTINQNTSWTITRSGTTTTYRVVAYGDSIFAGYYGSAFERRQARRAARRRRVPLARSGTRDIEVVRRTKSGAQADDIYNNKIVGERSYMQARLDARRDVRDVRQRLPAGALDASRARPAPATTAGLDTALANCTTYMEQAMQAINTYATTAKVKVISNLYYPGYDADNVLSRCTDATTGHDGEQAATSSSPTSRAATGGPATSPRQYGFKCADAFAEYMGADYDSNGDGLVDSEALRYRSGETEAAYVHADHRHAALDAPRLEHPLRQREHELRLHPVGRHPPDLLRRRPSSWASSRHRHLGLGRRRTSPTRRSWTARTRSGTGTATSGWARRSPRSIPRPRSKSPPRGWPGQKRNRATTSAGITA